MGRLVGPLRGELRKMKPPERAVLFCIFDQRSLLRHTGITMRTAHIQTVVWKEGKHYVSQCLNVDVSSFGSTKKSALENLKEALELYFENTQAPRLTSIKHPDIVSVTLRHA